MLRSKDGGLYSPPPFHIAAHLLTPISVAPCSPSGVVTLLWPPLATEEPACTDRRPYTIGMTAWFKASPIKGCRPIWSSAPLSKAGQPSRGSSSKLPQSPTEPVGLESNPAAAFTALYAALLRVFPRSNEALQEVVMALTLLCSSRCATLAAALAACAMPAGVAVASGVS